MTNIRALRAVTFILAAFGILAQGIVPAAVPTNSPANREEKKTTPPADLAITFEKNLGQFDDRVVFAGKGNGQAVFLTADEATFVMPMPTAGKERGPQNDGPRARRAEPEESRSVYALKMRFAGANDELETIFDGELEGKISYFKGSDPSKWAENVPRYARVTSRNLYNGIDAVWYGNAAGSMEYDLNVAPGSDPGQILLDFDGADRISVTASGDLEIETPAGPIYQKKPVVYQESGGLRSAVESGYTVKGSRVSFTLGSYARDKTLVIDPLPPIYYSTFLGGTDIDGATSVKADQFGNAYVTGYTWSTDYPIISGTNPANMDVFVTKLNSNGTALYYSALIGGSGNESGEAIAIDGSGNMYITGKTDSADFPHSWIAFDQSYNGNGDAFIFKINASGSMNYSTFVGGSGIDSANDIAIDSEGSAYITGSTASSNYPTTTRAYDQTLGNGEDAFVTKMNPGGYALTYSTYLGGNGTFETGNSLAVDSLGRAYVAGRAQGGGLFPVTTGSYHTSNNTLLSDCFVTKFNSAGSALIYSTLFGGDGQDYAASIAIDSSGNAYITGDTNSANYPFTLWAYDTTYSTGNTAAFVTKINNGGASLGYSSYLEGNNGLTEGRAIVADNSGNVTLVGLTFSTSFPVGPNAFDITHNGSADVFLVKMPTTPFSSLTTSTYLGGNGYDEPYGLAVDSAGFAFVVGRTASTNWPTTAGVFDSTYNGSYDAYVLRYEADYLP